MIQHRNPSLGITQNLNRILSVRQHFYFICNFLDTQTFQVKINNLLSEEYELLNGVPQGSSLSPTLFLIAINSITTNIELPVKATLYVDDFIFNCSSCSLKTVRNMLQNTTNNLIEWLKMTGFNFYPEKSQCIVFTKKQKKIRLYFFP